MLSKLGMIVLPPVTGTVKPSALLHPPFCSFRAIPLSAPGATVATTCVSLHDTTVSAASLPSQTTPLP